MRLPRATRILAAAFCAVAAPLLVAPAVQAEQINDLTVGAIVAPDSSMRIVETIVYDFQGAYRHGIYRDIPVYDELGLGKKRLYDIDVTAVLMDGGNVPFLATDEGPYRRLTIGDPNRTITGVHTYLIAYTVHDGLRTITAQDVEDPQFPAGVAPGDVELYWDLVGTGWTVPIAEASGVVIGPGTVLSAKCYYGPAGSTADCQARTLEDRALLGPVSLYPHEALTGAVTFPAAAFTTAPHENIQQGLPSDPGTGVALALIPGAVIVAVPVAFAVAHRRRDRGVVVPGAPAQYGPPDDLTPAEVAAAWRGAGSATAARPLLATVLDLAARGRITVAASARKELTVTWTGAGGATRPWEDETLALILKGRKSASLASYDQTLAKGWATVFRELVREQEAAGRRNPTGDAPDRRWRALGLVSVLGLLTAFLSSFFGQPFITAALFTVGGAGLLAFVLARTITPRRETQQSAVFLAKVNGLRKVLDADPAAARREFALRSGLQPRAIFATMLPFAVIFDLSKSWIGAFPDLTPEDLSTSGYHVADISLMDSFLSTGTSSLASATVAPSSGSGSGSGGGGSSGGGGGGGGGGSW